METLERVFEFQNQPVRTVSHKEEAWFIASDVCRILNLTNPTVVLSRLEDDERSKFNLGRQGMSNIVNESGLYELIWASRKPEAKLFKKWVKQEVLPSIRKHGAYATPQTIETILDNPDFGIELLTNLKEERNKRQAAEQQIEQQRPKVIFAEAYEVSDDTITVKEMANLLKQKGIDTGEKRLYRWFKDNGYICSKGSYYNLPTQRALDMGLFQIKKGVRTGTGGALRQTRTTKVTGKGQVYFVNKFIGQASAI
ncbi:phage antirepressor KilAC domain-containing protein [Terribacillus saccharophilus]|uniref:phage antirepressor KilAC domain-containing protein n=1 Tax=Terribacillus saccharophilus TaxID=361277 RepID=UPI000BA775F8|nr:phage antirepressor [Terribacillus saccharophilus]PAF19711.1 phage repressor protein/antirepressor Ant [Terribacillus saccharophilus]